MSAKPPRKRRDELEFVAPYSLKVCQKRLQTKARRRRSWLNALDTEVHLNTLNAETVTFNIWRGALVVRGRLDQLTDTSTLVTNQVRVNWFRQATIFFRPGVMVLFDIPFVLFSLYLAGLYFLSHFQMGDAPKPTPLSVREVLFLNWFGISLAIATFVYLFWYQAWQGRRELAQEVERALTDQITDVPDLGGAIGEIRVSDDGELVPAPRQIDEAGK